MSNIYLRVFKHGKGMRVTDGVTIPQELSVHKTYKSASFPICEDILKRLIDANEGLHVDQAIKDEIYKHSTSFITSEHIKEMKDTGGDPRLKEYQRVGAQWLVFMKKGILADEQGLGKTVMAAAACASLPLGPSFNIGVLCSKTNIPSWDDHMTKYFRNGEHAGTKIGANIYHKGRGTTYIANYDNAEALADKNLDVLIVDEAHNMRNRKTKIFTTVKKLAKHTPYLFLLTATPKVNVDQDMWTLLNLCDPLRFSSYWSYIFRFFNVSDTGFGIKIDGVKEDERENLATLISPYILSRDSSVLDLPGISKRIISYELSPIHRKIYNEMERDWETILYNTKISASVKVAQMTRLRQIAISPCLVLPGYDGREIFSGVDKISELVRVIESVEGNIVVFTSFESAAMLAKERLLNHGIPCEVLSGSVSSKNRDLIIKGFGKDHRVLIATHGTGGEGLNLTQATTAIFLDLAWHKAGNQHAMKRIHRIGQKEDVDVIVIKSENTIEDYVFEIIRRKAVVNITQIMKEMKRRRNV